jgi:hypothetical protein
LSLPKEDRVKVDEGKIENTRAVHEEESPFEKFCNLSQKIVSVPKKEVVHIDRMRKAQRRAQS